MMRLVLVNRFYSKELGMVYLLVGGSGKIRIVTSEIYLYSIRESIVNYKILKEKSTILDTRTRIKIESMLTFKTKDYFDIRDITYELYYARIGTLLAKGLTPREVAKYEINKWFEQDREEYKDSKFFYTQAMAYLG